MDEPKRIPFEKLPVGEVKSAKFNDYGNCVRIRYVCPYCGKTRVTTARGAKIGTVIGCQSGGSFHETVRYYIFNNDNTYVNNSWRKFFRLDNLSPLMRLVKRLNEEEEKT